MKNLNENAIREAAYYIWKNNGCPAGTSQQDWNLAIQQLSSNKSSSLLNNASSLLKTTSSAKKAAAKLLPAKSLPRKKLPQKPLPKQQLKSLNNLLKYLAIKNSS